MKSQPPYATAKRVFTDRRQRLVPSGCGGGQAAGRVVSTGVRAVQWPNLASSTCPIHASWLNQIEIYFGIIGRKVLSPNDFTDLDAVEHRLTAFQERYEQLAKPFEWKFTRADLRRPMAKLERSPLVGADA